MNFSKNIVLLLILSTSLFAQKQFGDKNLTIPITEELADSNVSEEEFETTLEETLNDLSEENLSRGLENLEKSIEVELERFDNMFKTSLETPVQPKKSDKTMITGFLLAFIGGAIAVVIYLHQTGRVK